MTADQGACCAPDGSSDYCTDSRIIGAASYYTANGSAHTGSNSPTLSSVAGFTSPQNGNQQECQCRNTMNARIQKLLFHKNGIEKAARKKQFSFADKLPLVTASIYN
jgi:hypothetical protein